MLIFWISDLNKRETRTHSQHWGTVQRQQHSALLHIAW